MGGEDAVHFCKPPTEEEAESWRRHWREEFEREHPYIPPPPMQHVGLAVELASGKGEREYHFRDVPYELRATSYAAGIELLQIQERFQLYSQVPLDDKLWDLRVLYERIAIIAVEHLVKAINPNPFLDADAREFQALLGFLLETGLTPAYSAPDGQPSAFNAVHHLLAFRACFHAYPVTWREFVAGLAYIRRSAAEAALAMYGTVAVAQWGDKEARERWIAAQEAAKR